MKIVLLTCQSASENWSQEAEALYVKKISPFFPIEIVHLKPSKISREDREVRRKADSDLIFKFLKDSDELILFDERGVSMDSRTFSKSIEKKLASGKKRLVFVIGGAYGVDERIRELANLQVSLSKLVFNHLVAQTVALEQIYRAFCIQKNLPYHND